MEGDPGGPPFASAFGGLPVTVIERGFRLAKMLSQVATIIRGSAGGVTYTANQYQQIIMRARTSPVNPGSTNQGRIRAAFSQAEVLWAGLTEGERSEWDQYSDTVTRTNVFGTYTAPGRQTFIGNIGLRKYLTARGVVFTSPVNTAPLTPGPLSIPVLTETAPASGTGFQVGVGNGNAEDCWAVWEISPPQRGTRNFWKGPWLSNQLAAVSVTASTSGVISFTSLTEDMIYFVRVRFITKGDVCRVSAPVIIRCTAVAFAA